MLFKAAFQAVLLYLRVHLTSPAVKVYEILIFLIKQEFYLLIIIQTKLTYLNKLVTNNLSCYNRAYDSC